MLRLPLLAFVMSLALLTGCGDSAETRSQGLADLQAIKKRWDDGLGVAGSTSRITLSGPVLNLQQIRRDLGGVKTSECLEDAKSALADEMDVTIASVLAFMGGNSSEKFSFEVGSSGATAYSDILKECSVSAREAKGLIAARAEKNAAKAQEDSEVKHALTAMRNVAMMAEATMENMEKKWDLGLFSTSEVRRISDTEADPALRKQKMLATIPVVAAWESAKAKAKEGGFEFRTPREGARNPANEPDPIEADALSFFDRNPDATEHYVIDTEKNVIRYFRPVRLGKTCMNCHGDPQTASVMWGRDDGKDITGFAMEDKQFGDLHGAFEIIQPLGVEDTVEDLTR